MGENLLKECFEDLYGMNYLRAYDEYFYRRVDSEHHRDERNKAFEYSNPIKMAFMIYDLMNILQNGNLREYEVMKRSKLINDARIKMLVAQFNAKISSYLQAVTWEEKRLSIGVSTPKLSPKFNPHE